MALKTPLPGNPYDKKGNEDSPPPSDEGMRHLTGINKDEEAKMEKRASEDLSELEESGGPSFYKGGKKKNSSDSSPLDSLFKYNSKADDSLAAKIKRNRRLMIIGGVAGTGLISLIIAIFGFLNVFKLDGVMSNIDARTLIRYNAAADRRSDRWIQSYLLLRLTQLKGASNADPDSEYFRANRVDNNNPARDWYRTLRTSSFENDLAKKGIVFVNRDASGPDGQKFTFSVLEVNGQEVAGLSDKDFRKGKLVDQLRGNSALVKNISAEVDLTKPGGNKEARKLIKKTINDVARSESVLRRRQIRKDIQNMTGVRNWRFFEGTRDKYDAKKTRIRNKIIQAAIPQDTKSGKWINCLLGISDCRGSEDPSDPQNHSDGSLGDNIKDGQPVDETDSKGKPLAPDKSKKIPLSDTTESFKAITSKVLEQANVVLKPLNMVSTLDSLSKVNKAIKDHTISKTVAVARGVQAMGLYQTFETARDQIKSGDSNPQEVNQFMQVISTVAASEAWTKVVEGHGDTKNLTNTAASKQYCSQEHQAQISKESITQASKEFAYLCPDKQIGGSSRAAELENAYNDGIGKVIGPLADAYQSARHVPVFGSLVDIALKIVNAVQGVISSVVMKIAGTVLKTLGISGDLQKIMQWIIESLSSFLGAGPIMNGNEPPGVYMNWLMQGGAYTAESSARQAGASLTTSQSAAASRIAVAEYSQDTASRQTIGDKIFSTSNPDSLASKTVIAVADFHLSNWTDKLLNLHSLFGTLFNLPFAHSFAAASNDGYRASNFAGIQTFDFPQQCYDLDPLSASPKDGTNIQQVLPDAHIPDSELTWDLVTNSSKWYEYVYSKTSDDTLAEKIYNCNLLDSAVRGSIGYVYGYTKDGGLDDGSSPTTAGFNSTSGSSSTAPTGNTSDLAKQILNSSEISFTTSLAKQAMQAAANGEPSAIEARCNAGSRVTLTPSLLSFIVTLSQKHTVGIGYLTNGCHSANSYHYQGKAVDLNTIDGRTVNGGDADRQLMHEITGMLPSGAGIGQSQCSSIPIIPLNNVRVFNDSCDHIHIEVP